MKPDGMVLYCQPLEARNDTQEYPGYEPATTPLERVETQEQQTGGMHSMTPLRNILTPVLTIGWLVGLAAARAQAAEVRMLCDFESPRDLRLWEINSGTPRLTDEWRSHGAHSLEIVFDPRGRYGAAYMTSSKLPRDWSAYDALILDVFNPNKRPVRATVLIADRAWQQKGSTYWNRHNSARVFAPGQGRWILPIHGLWRGEAGSRNNDIKRNIDPDQIVRVDFGFGRPGSSGRILVDALRLVKLTRPKSVYAFDFGPPQQSVMLGWTPVAHDTLYTRQRKYGWGPQGGHPWNGAARDTTFGPALLRDFCEAGGYNFRVDLPAGRYQVLVWYENSGYWGGEQARHRVRRILANGVMVWEEVRPDGQAHALYRFENIEPVGVDLWDAYMAAELARPARFEVRADADGIVFRFEADRVWGSKVAGLLIWPAAAADAQAWVREQQQEMAREFREQAVCLDPPAPKWSLPPAWRTTGLLAWPVRIENDITPTSLPEQPPAAPGSVRLTAEAARGEIESLCLAVRPARDFPGARFTLDAPTNAAGVALPATLYTVFYNTSRGFNTIAWRTRAHTLRRKPAVDLKKDVTREFIINVRIPQDASPGEYRGVVHLGELLTIPVVVRVHPATLDRETDFLMGFFGLMPPPLVPEEKRWQILEETLQLLHRYGMNAVSGGPNWRLLGWKNGQPRIDFGDMDRFFALLRKYGFTKPLNGYGGARFLRMHTRYEKGRDGERVERESGLHYAEALMRAWEAVHRHAREHGWPTILYAMCDETRVRARAERELAFMRLMQKVSARFPDTVRTSGSYSVDFRNRPRNPNDMKYWHQRFFAALDISSLNRHDESVLAEAKRLGKTIHIYNQGRSRYSFGLYQWSEYIKGVRARWQWHLNILHGYQFFDLDGREPDTAMICYGRSGLYTTIDFERCREGAEDFYLYNTLHRRTQALKRAGRAGDPAVRTATAMLDRLQRSVRLNQRNPPPGYDAEELKREVLAALDALARE